MNKILKKDIDDILKRYKKTNKEEIKDLCIRDYHLMTNIIYTFFEEENFKQVDINDQLTNNKTYSEMAGINTQIADNVDLLIELYEKALSLINNFNVNYIKYKNELEEFDLNILEDFFKNYPMFKELFDKIVSTEHLVFITGTHASYTYNLPSIDKEYIFICLDNPNQVLSAIAHEMGHVFQSKITFDNQLSNSSFLLEFISILMEHLFLDYYKSINEDMSNEIINNEVALWSNIMKECHGQLLLMKKHEDAFTNLYLNPIYKDELDELCDTNYLFKRDSLYLQYYSIGFLFAVEYLYQLKYGMDFNEVEKFYIESNKEINLNDLLSKMHIDCLRDYLLENINGNEKRKVRTLTK